MIIDKITLGHVTQKFDTKTKKCIEQAFIADDSAVFENKYGDSINPKKANEYYFPLEMKQPEK